MFVVLIKANILNTKHFLYACLDIDKINMASLNENC